MSERKAIPLFAPTNNRDLTVQRDARLVNGFVEKGDEQGEVYIYKRPGLIFDSQPSGGSATGRGVFFWRGNVYSVFNGTLYKNSTSVGSVDNAGMYTFTACLGATPALFLQNGANAYTYNGAALTHVTDADYPAATVPGCAYLDGTTYVFQSSNANINGSDFNAQLSWDPLNVLVAQIEPDRGVALAKQLVYIVAMKEWTTELFYDRGNATGSPLGPVQGAKINWGCRAAGSVRDVGGELIWVGGSREGAVSVLHMKQVKAQPISNPAIDRLLQNGDFTTTWSWSTKVAGHRLYGLTLKNSSITLVYDLTIGTWYQWTDSAGAYLPLVDSTINSSYQTIFQHESNGKLYRMDITAFQDDGASILFQLYTPSIDFGTRVKKYNSMMEIFADQTNGANFSLQFSDDDYQTWSTARTLANLNQDRPMFADMGEFRQRAYLISNTSNTFFRIKGAELVFDVGDI